MHRLGAAIATSADCAVQRNPGGVRNFYAGRGTIRNGASQANKNAFPSGYVHPYCWILAQKAGGMSSRGRIIGLGGVTAGNLAGGLNGAASLTGSGTISSASLALIVSAVASITGSGTISAAAIAGKLEAAAALAGSGNLAGALGALAGLSAPLTGSGALTGTPGAHGSMSADIVVTGTGLSTANVADAVWSAVAETGYSFADILRLLAAVAAGKTTIVDLGGGSATVTFRDLNDTKDRVVADMASSERADVTIDAT